MYAALERTWMYSQRVLNDYNQTADVPQNPEELFSAVPVVRKRIVVGYQVSPRITRIGRTRIRCHKKSGLAQTIQLGSTPD